MVEQPAFHPDIFGEAELVELLVVWTRTGLPHSAKHIAACTHTGAPIRKDRIAEVLNLPEGSLEIESAEVGDALR